MHSKSVRSQAPTAPQWQSNPSFRWYGDDKAALIGKHAMLPLQRVYG